MANSTANVNIGKPKIGGAIYRAPIGTTLPTSATVALDEKFVCLGYASDDGFTNSNSPTSNNIKAWGGDIVYTYNSDQTDTFGFTLLESTNPDVLKTVYGDDNVSGTLATGLVVKANTTEKSASSWVFELVLQGGGAKRIVVPKAFVTEIGEIGYSDESAVGYQITITAMVDDAGNTHYEYMTTATV
jgi:hypothetical protein